MESSPQRPMTWAQRIHHRKRMIERARRVLTLRTGDAAQKLSWAVRIHDHLKACSCRMCGNPRRFFGTPTVQELRRLPRDRPSATGE